MKIFANDSADAHSSPFAPLAMVSRAFTGFLDVQRIDKHLLRDSTSTNPFTSEVEIQMRNSGVEVCKSANHHALVTRRRGLVSG